MEECGGIFGAKKKSVGGDDVVGEMKFEGPYSLAEKFIM